MLEKERNNMKYELVAVSSTKVYVLNQDNDIAYLDTIVEANDGVTYIAGEFCDLKVQLVK